MAGWPPKKNAAFTWYFVIRDADGDLVAGATSLDVEYSIDGGVFADVAGTEVDEGGGLYSCPISAGEMNGDVIALICKTATAGAKTAAQVIYTSTRQIDDLAFPATSGRSIQVETDGMVHADVKEWLTAAPNALASGRVDASVGAMAAGVLTAAAIATDAITNAKIAADAIGASEFAQAAADKVWSSATRTVSAATNITSSGGTINVTAGVVDTVGALGATAKADVNAEVDTALADVNLNDLIQIAGSVNDATPAAGNFDGNAGLSATDNFYNGLVLVFTAGTLAGIARRISAYNGTTKNIALENAFPVAPTNGDAFSIIGVEVIASVATTVANIETDTQDIQARLPAVLVGGRMDSSVGAVAAGAITSSGFAAGAITATVIATDAIDADSLATDAVNEIVDQVWDEAKAGHVGAGSFGEEVQSHALTSEVSAVETDTQDIQNRLPSTLIGGRMDSSVGAITNNVNAANRLKDSAGTMVFGTVSTGSSTTTVTSDLSESTNDHYKGRVIIFLTNNLANQAAEVTGYNGTTGDLTVTALTEPPASGDTFILV